MSTRTEDEKHCPSGQCRHVTRAEKQQAHGTPQEFRRAVINAVGDFLSHDEANQAIDRYEREWEAAPLARTHRMCVRLGEPTTTRTSPMRLNGSAT